MKNIWWWVIGFVIIAGVALFAYDRSQQGEGATVKVGVAIPLTGIAAIVGENERNGIQIGSR